MDEIKFIKFVDSYQVHHFKLQNKTPKKKSPPKPKGKKGFHRSKKAARRW